MRANLMNNFNNLLAVGATNRNLGKTEFICSLLNRFQKYNIIAIKIKTQYKGDERFHGKGERLTEGYIIREEEYTTGIEDSKRFLEAGAIKVYYIKSTIEGLREAVSELKTRYPSSQLFLCESNSLLEYFNPGGFILIEGPEKDKYKPSSLKFQSRANIRIKSDGKKFDIEPESLNKRIEKNKCNIEQ